MSRILFVDEDVALLDSLRVWLHRASPDWSMTFADSGAQALIALQREPYDLILSDVHMPGMSGTRLLRAVSERWPQTIRIALSGYPDYRVSQLASIAHRFLSKPCEPTLLENTISQCLRLQRLVPESGLRATLGRSLRLAPARENQALLRACLEARATALDEVTRIAGRDTVIAARLLQVANATLPRPEPPVVDLEEAVRRLPSAALRSLLTSPEVFAQWPPRQATTLLDLEHLQEHTQQVVRAARALTAGTELERETVAAALLHDIGYWILAGERPHELKEAVEIAAARDRPLEEAERHVFGASHAEIGAYVLGLWGLPEPLIGAVAHHHEPDTAAGQPFDAGAALAVAQALCGSDETDAFSIDLKPSARVGPEFLTSRSAPFTWSEAQRRIATIRAA